MVPLMGCIYFKRLNLKVVNPTTLEVGLCLSAQACAARQAGVITPSADAQGVAQINLYDQWTSEGCVL